VPHQHRFGAAKARLPQKSHLPFLITLEECKASLVEQALQQINSLDFLVQPCLHLPIL
jgi:hypothetical protein